MPRTSIIDTRIAEYTKKLEDERRNVQHEGLSSGEWEEHKSWLQGVVFGLKVAKNI